MLKGKLCSTYDGGRRAEETNNAVEMCPVGFARDVASRGERPGDHTRKTLAKTLLPVLKLAGSLPQAGIYVGLA